MKRSQDDPLIITGKRAKIFPEFSPDVCTKLLKNSDDIIIKNKTKYYNNNNYSLRIVCALTNKSYNHPISETLESSDLSLGHTLAVDYLNQQFVPLFFDLDCKLCQNNTTDHFVSTVNHNVINDILQVLFNKTNLNSFGDLNKYVVFKSSNPKKLCGMHIYFSLNHLVSIPLYCSICELLNATITKNSNFVVDMPKNMPLPFSGKNDNEIYSPFMTEGAFNLSFSSYLDCDYFLSDMTKDDSLPIISLKKNSKLHILYSKLNTIKQVSPTLNSLLVFNVSSAVEFQTNSQILSAHLEKYRKVDYKYELYKNLPTSPATIKLVELFSDYKTLIFKNESDPEKQATLLILYITSNFTCDYLFYFISSYILKYSANDVEMKIAVKELKDLLVEFINLNSTLIGNHEKILEVISKNCGPLLRYNNFETIKRSFTSDLLDDTITTITYLKNVNNTYIKELAYKYLVFEDYVEDSIAFAEEICKIYKKTLKLSLDLYDKDKIYSYNFKTGIYQQTKSSAYQQIDSIITLICRKEIGEKKNLQLKEIFTLAKTKFEESLTGNTYFNKYVYFICTKKGVFNSLTGMYMSYNSNLYFNLQRNYMLLYDNPQNKTDQDQINDSILEYSKGSTYIIDNMKYISNQTQWLGILLPGLLSLENAMINDEIISYIFNYSYYLIVHNKCDLPHYDLLIKQYNLNILGVYNLYLILQDNKNTVDSFKNLETFNFKYNAMLGDINDKNSMFNNTKYDITIDINKDILSQFVDDMNDDVFKWVYVLGILYYLKFKNGNNDLKIYKNATQYCSILDIYNVKVNDISNVDLVELAVCEVLKGKNIHYTNILSIAYLFRLFNYNVELILDVLLSLGSLFQPENNNRRIMIFQGPPSCGKSEFISVLENPCLPEVYKRHKMLHEAKDAGPDSHLIPIFEKPLTIITECKGLPDSLIKTVSGNDSNSLRNVFKRSHHLIFPLVTIIGVSNNLISLTVNEAIRTRLAIFKFSITFIKNKQDEFVDNPILYKMYKKHVISPTNNTILSPGVYSLIYAMYASNLNNAGVLLNDIKNKISLLSLRQLFIHNNLLYRILYDNNIEINNIHASISEVELYNIIKTGYEKYENKDKPTNITFKMEELKVLFQAYYHEGETQTTGYFKGVGKVNKDVELDFEITDFIIKSDSADDYITLDDIVKLMKSIKIGNETLADNQVRSIFGKLYSKYKNFIKNGKIYEHKFKK